MRLAIHLPHRHQPAPVVALSGRPCGHVVFVGACHCCQRAKHDRLVAQERDAVAARERWEREHA